MHTQFSLLLAFLGFLPLLVIASPAPMPESLAEPNPQLGSGLLGGGLLGGILNLVPILASPPPSFLWTKNPSPECANVNGGHLYYCQSVINGDLPLVVALADGVGYKLNPNSVNCLYPTQPTNSTRNCSAIKQCCQVDALATTPISSVLSLAIYCQAPPS